MEGPRLDSPFPGRQAPGPLLVSAPPEQEHGTPRSLFGLGEEEVIGGVDGAARGLGQGAGPGDDHVPGLQAGGLARRSWRHALDHGAVAGAFLRQAQAAVHGDEQIPCFLVSQRIGGFAQPFAGLRVFLGEVCGTRPFRLSSTNPHCPRLRPRLLVLVDPRQVGEGGDRRQRPHVARTGGQVPGAERDAGRAGDLVAPAGDEGEGEMGAGLQLQDGPRGQAVEQAQGLRGAARRDPQGRSGNLIDQGRRLARGGRFGGGDDCQKAQSTGEGSNHSVGLLGIGGSARRRIRATAGAPSAVGRRATGSSRPALQKIAIDRTR